MEWPTPQPHTHPPTPSPHLSALPPPPNPPAFTAPLASALHAQQPFFASPSTPSRPRLKRSHPTAHSALVSGPASSAQTLATSPAGGGASPQSHARTRSTSSSTSLGALEPIKEWPGAEGDGTSSLGLNLGVQPQSRVDGDDGTLERAPKRARVAPDLEAFGRLSLSTTGEPVSPTTTLTYSPLSTVPPDLPTPLSQVRAPPPTPLLLNTSRLPPSTLAPVSFPPAAPSSSIPSSFHTQAHAPTSSPPISAPSLPAAPPTSPVQSAACGSVRSPLSASSAGTSLPTIPWSQSSFISPPRQEEPGQAEEVDMRPAASSWSTGPHTIYVASLDSDSDTEAPSPAPKEVEVNPLALRGGKDDPAARLLLSKLHEAAASPASSGAGAGSLILYRPPPSFAPAAPSSSPEPDLVDAESAKDRALRERRAKRTSDEWGEFVRMREREEAMHDLGDEEAPVEENGEDGMEMD